MTLFYSGAATTGYVFGDWSVEASHAENAPAATFPWNHVAMNKGYDHASYVLTHFISWILIAGL
jgi:hypothetical protein